MMKVKSNEEIKAFLSEYAKNLGVELISAEFKQGKNPSLEIVIHKDGGVDLDTCALFHNAISEPLDQLDPTYQMPYTLNVSSRGIDWAFKTDDDFVSHIGQRVEVKLYASIKGKKFYDGVLMQYSADGIVLKVDDKNTFTIDKKNIVKVNEYIDFE
jgi:ribosome maturation factor RimP